jgi:hypothetical protein
LARNVLHLVIGALAAHAVLAATEAEAMQRRLAAIAADIHATDAAKSPLEIRLARCVETHDGAGAAEAERELATLVARHRDCVAALAQLRTDLLALISAHTTA